jgi:hypothetical protein
MLLNMSTWKLPSLAIVVLAALGGGSASAQERPAKNVPVLKVDEWTSSLAFSADGKTLACDLALRDTATGKLLGRGKVSMGTSALGREGTAETTYAVFSPDGKQLATVHFDTGLISARHAICLWNVTPERDLKLARTLLYVKEQHARYRESLYYLAFSADGKLLATRYPDDVTVVWETANGKERLRLDTEGLAVSFSPDGRTLIAVSRDGQVHHWDLATKKCSVPNGGGKREEFLFVIQAIASADGKTLALTDDYSIILKEARSGKTLRRFDDVRPGCLALSTSGSMLVLSRRKDVILFDTATGKELARLKEPQKRIGPLAFSADAKYLAVGGSEEGASVWSIDKLGRERNGKADPKPSPVPLEARITSRQPSYTLDLGGKTPEEFARLVNRGSLPPSPKVDLILTLRNTGDKKLLLDPDVRVYLHLVGKAAMNHPEESYQTGVGFGDRPNKVALVPGETYSVPIKSLNQEHGKQSYWLLPGEYELHADGRVVVSQGSAGRQEREELIFVDLQIPRLRLKVRAEK